jgi:hypothetical protein
MADFARKVQSDNKHLASSTSARYAHPQVSSTTTIRSTGGRLLRVILNTNGGTVTLRDGSDVIGIIAADAPEGTFNYGIYCNTSIIVETGATVDCTVVFSD